MDRRAAFVLPPLSKGLPLAPVQALDTDAVRAAGWNALDDDLPYPLALLKESALAHNSRWMAGFVRHFDVSIAPHGKTTMSPALHRRQLDDGAWGITAATAQQAAVMVSFGVTRVLIANQLAGRAEQRWAFGLLAERPDVALIALVDSVEGVAALDRTGREMAAARPLSVMVELGIEGGRTGARGIEAGLAVARAAAASPMLRLVGVEGYEAATPAASEPERENGIRAFVADLGRLAARCAGESLFADDVVLLSAGGSAYFDLVTTLPRTLAGRATRIVLRSGCYLTHDGGHYARLLARLAQRTPEVAALGEGLQPALEVWGVVQSTPEPGLAIVTMGKRDVSHDIDLPMPRRHVRGHGATRAISAADPSWRITALNDQHAFLRGRPGTLPALGDRIGCAISHPCTTFDKWRVMLVVDDDYRVVDALTTWF